MKFDSSIPIYLQVMDMIRRDLVTGKILPGQKLPSSRELALTYTINPNTAGKVYQELEKEQLCFTRRGLGTFATEDAERILVLREEMASHLVEQFLKGMEQLGITEEEAKKRIERMRK